MSDSSRQSAKRLVNMYRQAAPNNKNTLLPLLTLLTKNEWYSADEKSKMPMSRSE
jgi:hypothetical protein